MPSDPIITPRGGHPLIRPIAAPRAAVFARRAFELTAICVVLALTTGGCRGGGGAGKSGPSTVGAAHTANASDKAQAMNRYVDGLRAYHAGDKAAAKTAFAEATAANPDMIMARSMLGDVYREDKEYAKAAEQYDALTKLD